MLESSRVEIKGYVENSVENDPAVSLFLISLGSKNNTAFSKQERTCQAHIEHSIFMV